MTELLTITQNISITEIAPYLIPFFGIVGLVINYQEKKFQKNVTLSKNNR